MSIGEIVAISFINGLLVYIAIQLTYIRIAVEKKI